MVQPSAVEHGETIVGPSPIGSSSPMSGRTATQRLAPVGTPRSTRAHALDDDGRRCAMTKCSMMVDRSQMSDWQLVSVWQAGDKSAGDLLFERHFGFLRSFFRSKLNNQDDVHDLVIETMLAWMRNPPTPRSDIPFRAFLAGVAMNILRRHLRKELKRQRERNDFAAICLKDRVMEKSMSSRISPAARALVQALSKLPQEQQVVLAMTYLDDLTASEIAKSLGVPVPTVYTRLRRGRIRLRAIMAESGEAPGRVSLQMPTIRTWARGVVGKVAA